MSGNCPSQAVGPADRMSAHGPFGADMRRREFITVLSATAAAWPFAVRAQQPVSTMPVIGLLHAGRPEESASRLQAFRSGLSENGYEEGRNLTIEYRWANGDYSRLAVLRRNS